MVSVERVMDYSSLPSEAQLRTDEKYKISDDWPQRGEIAATRVSMKYLENSPNILQDLTFTVKSKEKVNDSYNIILYQVYEFVI